MSNLSSIFFKPITLFIALGALSLSLNAGAEEVKALRGKPSSDMILDALSGPAKSETPAAPAVRRRGLSLNSNNEAAEPSSGNELKTQTAMQAPAPAAPQRRALDLEIKFQFNSDQLTDDGKDVLDQLAAALKSDRLAGTKSIILEGHADAKGSANYNQALSFKRAQSARNYLASRHGFSGAKLKAIGKGSTELADPNNPEDEVNRRVRVILDL